MCKKNIGDKVKVVFAFFAFSGKAQLCRKCFEQIEGNMPDDSEIHGTVVHPHTTIIFMKHNVQTPMQRVFNAPVALFLSFYHMSRGYTI